MIQVLSPSQLSVTLREQADRLTNLAPVLNRGRIAAISDVQNRFQLAQDSNGKPWVPLKHGRPSGGSKPLLDRGLLRASITGVSDQTTIKLGTVHPQANLHQFGGTITPKRSKFLAIPATVEAKRSGGPRRFPDTLRPVIGKKGGVLIDSQGKVQFYLSRRVTIPARPFMGWSQSFLDLLNVMISEYVSTGRV